MIFNIFGVFRKVNIFGGMKFLWLWGGESPQNWTGLRVILCIFGSFIKGLIKFQIYFGYAYIPYIFEGKQ